MKKLIKMATVVASVGAMLSFAGCGGNNGDSPEAAVTEVMKIMMKEFDLKGSSKVVECKYSADKKSATVVVVSNIGGEEDRSTFVVKNIDGVWAEVINNIPNAFLKGFKKSGNEWRPIE